jgi:hypothetical protein
MFSLLRRAVAPPPATQTDSRGGPCVASSAWCEAPARPIGTLRVGAVEGLPALLSGSKKRRRILGRAGVSPFWLPASKMLRGALWGAPVEMLLQPTLHVLLSDDALFPTFFSSSSF